MADLIVLFQSTRYDPKREYDRYLHCAQDGRLIVSEREKPGEPGAGYVVRDYVLPEEDHSRYTKAITEARRLQGHFPNLTELTPD